MHRLSRRPLRCLLCRCVQSVDDQRYVDILVEGLLSDDEAAYGELKASLCRPAGFQQLCDTLRSRPASADQQFAVFLPPPTVREKKLALAGCSSLVRLAQVLRSRTAGSLGAPAASADVELEKRDGISLFIEGSFERLPGALQENVRWGGSLWLQRPSDLIDIHQYPFCLLAYLLSLPNTPTLRRLPFSSTGAHRHHSLLHYGPRVPAAQ